MAPPPRQSAGADFLRSAPCVSGASTELGALREGGQGPSRAIAIVAHSPPHRQRAPAARACTIGSTRARCTGQRMRRQSRSYLHPRRVYAAHRTALDCHDGGAHGRTCVSAVRAPRCRIGARYTVARARSRDLRSLHAQVASRCGRTRFSLYRREIVPRVGTVLIPFSLPARKQR